MLRFVLTMVGLRDRRRVFMISYSVAAVNCVINSVPKSSSISRSQVLMRFRVYCLSSTLPKCSLSILLKKFCAEP